MQDTRWEESYSSEDMESVYSTAPTDLAISYKDKFGVKLPTEIDLPLKQRNQTKSKRGI